MKSVDIFCTACGADTLVVRKPKYEGFTKVGEVFVCSACGHEYATEEEVPFKEKPELKVFTEADRPKEIKVFREDEKGRLCRYCENYVINPFMQWCALHKKEVEATDTCKKFTPKKEPPKPPV